MAGTRFLCLFAARTHLVSPLLLLTFSHSALTDSWDQPVYPAQSLQPAVPQWTAGLGGSAPQPVQLDQPLIPSNGQHFELSHGRASDLQVDESATPQAPGTEAIIAPDPHAPAAYNCLAAGHGIHEGEVGKRTRFQIFSRDMFGDAHPCSPDYFSVRVLHLTPAADEDSVVCDEQVGQRCTRCRGTTVCYEGNEDGACSYVYTPETPGFFRVMILTPSSKGEGLVNIQGSPFRAHVEDGGMFLPGMSLSTYVLLFLTSIGGAVVVLSFFLSAAWNRFKSRQPPDEYQAEIARLEEMAAELENVQGQREESRRLLAELEASGALKHIPEDSELSHFIEPDSDAESVPADDTPWIKKATDGIEAARAAYSMFSPDRPQPDGATNSALPSVFHHFDTDNHLGIDRFTIDDDEWGA